MLAHEEAGHVIPAHGLAVPHRAQASQMGDGLPPTPLHTPDHTPDPTPGPTPPTPPIFFKSSKAPPAPLTGIQEQEVDPAVLCLHFLDNRIHRGLVGLVELP